MLAPWNRNRLMAKLGSDCPIPGEDKKERSLRGRECFESPIYFRPISVNSAF